MSEQWENDDVVTTTYGSVQLSLRQAYTAGTITERNRILELVERIKMTSTPSSKEFDVLIDVIKLIKGEADE